MKYTARSTEQVLKIEDLHVAYRMHNTWVDVVRGVSLNVRRVETYGLVGESGCGKSTSAYAIVNYLGYNGRVTNGQINFLGEDLAGKSENEIRSLRGQRISMVYQNPQTALNPALRTGKQIAEVLQTHDNIGANEAWGRAIEMLERVHMPDPERVMRRYPHQLSGGMQQRILIAMALITNPDLLIMDEPTTGLDVTTQATVLDLVNELKQVYNSAILYISHDLGVIAQVCDRVGVMYAGQLVESGTVEEIFHQPRHPYSLDLMGCITRLDRHYRSSGGLRAIEGNVPLPTHLPAGCVYEPRCRFAREICRSTRPELTNGSSKHLARCFFGEEVANEAIAVETQEKKIWAEREHDLQREIKTLLSIKDVKKYYGQGHKPFIFFGKSQPRVKAVNGISVRSGEGETLSLVGESGCGKTTLGRCVVGLLTPTEGEIIFRDTDATLPAAKRPADLRQEMQIVFQHPDSSLNPRYRVGHILDRTLQLFGMKSKKERQNRVAELLEAVRLDASYIHRFPIQLSGGEQQRVAIARAFAGNPSMVVCDEAVSSLDVSVQASILNLLVELKREKGCAYLFISHDLSVVSYISDSIGVMYLGKLMEIGTSEQVFEPPRHPYTEALLSAVQSPDPLVELKPIRLEGAVPSPADPPSGCPFHTRCQLNIGKVCEETLPPWKEVGDGHYIACHIPPDGLMY